MGRTLIPGKRYPGSVFAPVTVAVRTDTPPLDFRGLSRSTLLAIAAALRMTHN